MSSHVGGIIIIIPQERRARPGHPPPPPPPPPGPWRQSSRPRPTPAKTGLNQSILRDRAVDPHYFFADPAVFLNTDPDSAAF